MTYIEIPLWLAIVIAVILFIVVLHLMFGDLVANTLCRYLKKKDEERKENDE